MLPCLQIVFFSWSRENEFFYQKEKKDEGTEKRKIYSCEKSRRYSNLFFWSPLETHYDGSQEGGRPRKNNYDPFQRFVVYFFYLVTFPFSADRKSLEKSGIR